MLNRLALVLVCSTLSLGYAAGGGRPAKRPLRGTVTAAGPSVHAIVAGPANLHAYAERAGGRVFLAEDCSRPAPSSRAQKLRAGRLTVEVPAGRVACLATEAPHAFELSWFARPL